MVWIAFARSKQTKYEPRFPLGNHVPFSRIVSLRWFVTNAYVVEKEEMDTVSFWCLCCVFVSFFGYCFAVHYYYRQKNANSEPNLVKKVQDRTR